MVAGLDRRAGYETALLSVVREVSDDLVELGDFSEQSGASAMRQLLERRPDIDAVFAANDLMAVGAMGYLRDAADTRRADHPAGSGAGAVGLPARLVVRGSS
jgi:DNA-binding LacI/PurR family transcriptional regulator